MGVKSADTKLPASWLCVLSRGRPTDPDPGGAFYYGGAMTKSEIAKLKELAEKATPGAWTAYTGSASENGTVLGPTAFAPIELTDEDAAFIAHANPAAILSLIERLERHEAALAHYANDAQFSSGETMTDQQKRDMDDYGSIAREALDEGSKT